MERIRSEGQNFFEVVAPQEEEEHAHTICNIYSVSNEKIVALTRLIITLQAYCL